jgi:hypothetical protein
MEFKWRLHNKSYASHSAFQEPCYIMCILDIRSQRVTKILEVTQTIIHNCIIEKAEGAQVEPLIRLHNSIFIIVISDRNHLLASDSLCEVVVIRLQMKE